jgi:predicted lipid-binding transport protein (Tim44 family)
VNPAVAYAGDSNDYGTAADPLATTHAKVGGINVFGGGLALYNGNGILVGGLGVSGDSSCADHVIAWRLRHMLGLDFVPAGVNTDSARPDNIIYDIDQPGNSRAIAPSSASGWGQPHCLPTDVAPSSLPATQHP